MLAGGLFPLSNGQGGHVTRVKLLKRVMHDRASFSLLRHCVLHVAGATSCDLSGSRGHGQQSPKTAPSSVPFVFDKVVSGLVTRGTTSTQGPATLYNSRENQLPAHCKLSWRFTPSLKSAAELALVVA